MKADELKEILEQHNLWLADKPTGKRADLSGADLSGADLSYANLSFANLSRADLSDVTLIGADLSGFDLFGADLSEANLGKADLRGATLIGANLRYADLRGATLIGANLRFASLRFANLRGAYLSRVNLIGASLPTVDPYPNLVEKIAEQIDAQAGSLDMRKWHTCDTTHCLGGWAVTLHPQGKKLESEIGTSAAAALIFNAACGEVPDFHSSDSDAMEWLKSKAKKGAQL